jgi:hypothetical protein
MGHKQSKSAELPPPPGIDLQLLRQRIEELEQIAPPIRPDMPNYRRQLFNRELGELFNERHLTPILYEFYKDPEIGDCLEGGVVFYVDRENKRALVAALTDIFLEDLYRWSEGYSTTPGISTQLFSGFENTKKLCATPIHQAARASRHYKRGNKDDWYLPSIAELYQLYLNKDIVNQILIKQGKNPLKMEPRGDAQGRPYWSSSEYDYQDAYCIYFGDPPGWRRGENFRAQIFIQSGLGYVHPIRQFHYVI